MIESRIPAKTSENLSTYWKALHATERLALHATIYTWAAKQIPSGRVLDLGCEYGFGTMLVAESNPEVQVIGLDLDLKSMRYAHSIPSMNRIPRVHADASMLPITSGSLSGVFLINILHLVEERGAILSEVRRVLKTGGIAVVSVPRQDLGEAASSKLISELQSEITARFSQVTYPHVICGQIPSFQSRSFLLDQLTSPWTVLCWKN